MSKRSLLEFFRTGKMPIEEMGNPVGFGLGFDGANAGNITARRQKLEDQWRDCLTKLETLWLDVSELDADVYEIALETLDEIRKQTPDNAKQLLPQFANLVHILKDAVEKADDKGKKDLQLYLARQEELGHEVEYIASELDPDIPAPPGLPPKSKKDWEKSQDDGKHKTESKLSCSTPKSLLASLTALSSAHESALDLDAVAQSVGEALASCIREHGVAESVLVQIGETRPGNLPRLDVYLEWADDEPYGYAQVRIERDDTDRKVYATINNERTGEGHCQIVAETFDTREFCIRIGELCTLVQEASPRRTTRENRVAHQLFKLLTKASRGADLPESWWAQTLAGLRTEVGLHENVNIAPHRIHVVFDGPNRYHLAWYESQVKSLSEADAHLSTSMRFLAANPGDYTAWEQACSAAERAGRVITAYHRIYHKVRVLGPSGNRHLFINPVSPASHHDRLKTVPYQELSLPVLEDGNPSNALAAPWTGGGAGAAPAPGAPVGTAPAGQPAFVALLPIAAVGAAPAPAPQVPWQDNAHIQDLVHALKTSPRSGMAWRQLIIAAKKASCMVRATTPALGRGVEVCDVTDDNIYVVLDDGSKIDLNQYGEDLARGLYIEMVASGRSLPSYNPNVTQPAGVVPSTPANQPNGVSVVDPSVLRGHLPISPTSSVQIDRQLEAKKAGCSLRPGEDDVEKHLSYGMPVCDDCVSYGGYSHKNVAEQTDDGYDFFEAAHPEDCMCPFHGGHEPHDGLGHEDDALGDSPLHHSLNPDDPEVQKAAKKAAAKARTRATRLKLDGDIAHTIAFLKGSGEVQDPHNGWAKLHDLVNKSGRDLKFNGGKVIGVDKSKSHTGATVTGMPARSFYVHVEMPNGEKKTWPIKAPRIDLKNLKITKRNRPGEINKHDEAKALNVRVTSVTRTPTLFINVAERKVVVESEPPHEIEPDMTDEQVAEILARLSYFDYCPGIGLAEQSATIQVDRKHYARVLETPAGDRFVEVSADDLGISRSRMPQISADRIEDYVGWLGRQGVNALRCDMPVQQLLDTQDELNAEKVQALCDKGLEALLGDCQKMPLLLGGELRVLDGHHRSAAIHKLDPNAVVPCLKIDMPVEELITLSQTYPGVRHKDVEEQRTEGKVAVSGWSDMVLNHGVTEVHRERDPDLKLAKITKSGMVFGVRPRFVEMVGRMFALPVHIAEVEKLSEKVADLTESKLLTLKTITPMAEMDAQLQSLVRRVKMDPYNCEAWNALIRAARRAGKYITCQEFAPSSHPDLMVGCVSDYHDGRRPALFFTNNRSQWRDIESYSDSELMSLGRISMSHCAKWLAVVESVSEMGMTGNVGSGVPMPLGAPQSEEEPPEDEDGIPYVPDGDESMFAPADWRDPQTSHAAEAVDKVEDEGPGVGQKRAGVASDGKPATESDHTNLADLIGIFGADFDRQVGIDTGEAPIADMLTQCLNQDGSITHGVRNEAEGTDTYADAAQVGADCPTQSCADGSISPGINAEAIDNVDTFATMPPQSPELKKEGDPEPEDEISGEMGFYREGEKLPGGKGDRTSPAELAAKHGVPLTHIQDQLNQGIAVELEHTPDFDKATEIALDHLSEDPNYYTKLQKVHAEAADRELSQLAKLKSRLSELGASVSGGSGAPKKQRGREGNSQADQERPSPAKTNDDTARKQDKNKERDQTPSDVADPEQRDDEQDGGPGKELDQFGGGGDKQGGKTTTVELKFADAEDATKAMQWFKQLGLMTAQDKPNVVRVAASDGNEVEIITRTANAFGLRLT